MYHRAQQSSWRASRCSQRASVKPGKSGKVAQNLGSLAVPGLGIRWPPAISFTDGG